MIKEAYVSFEVGKLLKEKGFDGLCSTAYETITSKHNIEEVAISNWGKLNQIKRPTHQMAMAWLRTKHRIIVVYPEYFNVDGICSYWGVDIWESDNYVKLQGDYPSYEEAVEEALKYCLKNLI